MWFKMHMIEFYLRNELDFWKVHGIMNTSGLLQTSGFTLTLQETQSIHGFMNLPKVEFYYLYLHFILSVKYQFSPNLAGFPNIFN